MKDQKTKTKEVPRKQKGSQTPRVWINPNSSFKGPRSTHAWDQQAQAPPTAARLLELADVALRAAQPSTSATRKKKAAA